VAHLYAYFDESGKQSDHAVITMCGFVDGFERWRTFQDKWMRLLRETQLGEFHAAKAIRHSHSYGRMRCGTSDERAEDILPFIREITEGIELGIAFAIDVKAYQSQRFSVLHRAFGINPHNFAFFVTVNSVLSCYKIPRHLTIGLIFDDEEKHAIECYRILKKMKLANPEVRRRITSICFSDDGSTPVLQASDLLAYLTRVEAERRFTGKPYPYGKLFSAFQNLSPTGKHLHFDSGFYDFEELSKYQAWHLENTK